MSKLSLIMMSISVSLTANAADFADCTQHFFKGKAPVITKASLAKNTYSFCFNGYAVKYSGVSKTGLWSAHYLTPQRIQSGKSVNRENNFHEEYRVKKEHRALLADYKGSGFDRGHLSPSADQGTRQQQNESFNLSNMIPQAPENNQKNWNNVEQSVRAFVTKNKTPAYVVTGALFLGDRVRKVGSVLAPSHVYKVVYFPNLNIVGAYVAVNDNSGRIDSTSLAQLEQHAGVRFFPMLDNSPVQRYELPLTSNQAYKMQRINVLSNQNSQIFQANPDNSLNYREVYTVNDGGISKEVIKDKIMDFGISILKKSLN